MEHFKNLLLENISEDIDGVIVKETWVDISLFIGYYMVSNFGRIKSLGRVIITKAGKEYTVSEKIRRQSSDKDGYLSIHLSINQEKATFKTHRVVAAHFIPNPNKLPEVNHKKFIKTDNRVSQLEWCTSQENTIHSFRESNRVSGMKGKQGELHHNSKKVFCSTLGLAFGSAAEAQRYLGLTGVSEVCNGKLLHSKGFVFRYI
jgi:hypothetical protein